MTTVSSTRKAWKANCSWCCLYYIISWSLYNMLEWTNRPKRKGGWLGNMIACFDLVCCVCSHPFMSNNQQSSAFIVGHRAIVWKKRVKEKTRTSACGWLSWKEAEEVKILNISCDVMIHRWIFIGGRRFPSPHHNFNYFLYTIISPISQLWKQAPHHSNGRSFDSAPTLPRRR